MTQPIQQNPHEGRGRFVTHEGPFTVRMAPGQEPYTPEEYEKLKALVGGAAEAQDIYGDDELERAAEMERRAL